MLPMVARLSLGTYTSTELLLGLTSLAAVFCGPYNASDHTSQSSATTWLSICYKAHNSIDHKWYIPILEIVNFIYSFFLRV